MSTYTKNAKASNAVYNGSSVVNALPNGNLSYSHNYANQNTGLYSPDINYGSGYYRTSTSGIYVVKTDIGKLYGISINSSGLAGGVLNLYDNKTVPSGNVICSYDISKITSPTVFNYSPGIPFTNGLTIYRVGTWDCTIIYG